MKFFSTSNLTTKMFFFFGLLAFSLIPETKAEKEPIKKNSAEKSVVVIPVSEKESFFDLKYNDIKSNKVSIDKTIRVQVQGSASPLFLPLKVASMVKSVEVKGQLTIRTPIKENVEDAYFQLGLVYAGDYKPSGVAKWFAPDWITTIVKASNGQGLGLIHFYDVSPKGKNQNRTSKHDGITIVSETVAYLNEMEFQLNIEPQANPILGFWLNMEGDHSKADFDVELTHLEYVLQ